MRSASFLVSLAFLAASAPAVACNVPVFRYALERWPADCYEVVLFHRGPLTAAEQALADQWRKACAVRPARPNCTLELVDVSQPLSGPRRDLWQAQESPRLPWLVVRYPESDEDRPPVWSGPLSADHIQPMLDSPARREVARRLLRGDSVVWVLLETGDPAKDQAAADLLQKELGRLEKTLKLPKDDGQDTVPLLSELPLRIRFSMLRVAPHDPAEGLLVAMLRGMEKRKEQVADPVVFPVFGRGRVLGGLFGPEVTADALREVAEFLCGACSCLVKRLNPGLDLLLAADWESVLENPPDEPPDSPREGEVIPIPTGSTPLRAGAADVVPPSPSWQRFLPGMIAAASVLAVASGVWVWRSQRRKWRQDSAAATGGESGREK